MTYLPRHLTTVCDCDEPSLTSGLISLDQALLRVSTHVHCIERSETAAIHACRGRVLAVPVFATSDMPRFDHAAMDGYAVNSKAFEGEGPWLFPVTERIAAGDAPVTECAVTDACRIFTGAPIADPFDCVVMQEHVERLGKMIRLDRPPLRGENIRLRGQEHRRGAQILTPGIALTPRAIAACAAAGHGTVDIRSRVRVSLLASGSEVVAPGATSIADGAIWDVNTPMLRALLARPDVDLVQVLCVEDNENSIRCALETAAARSDMIVSTGGVSIGDEDHLHAAVKAAGGEIVFAGVAIKPGKPIAVGRIGKATWVGLPGNPGSAYVTWTIIGQTVLNTLAGRASTYPLRRHVVLGHPLARKPGRYEIRAASILGVDDQGRDVVQCAADVNSGQVSLLAGSDGLVFLPPEMDQIPEGALIGFFPFCTD